MLEHHQIVVGLQAANGILRPLQQQHIPLAQLGPAQALPQHGVAAPQGEHGHVVALAEAQIPQAVAGQGGARGKQHLHHPLVVLLVWPD